LRIAQQVSCISTPSWFLEANVKREGSKGSDATATEGLSESLDLTDLLDSRSRGDFGTRGERGGVREGAPRARASSVFVVAAASAPPRRDRVLGPLCAPPLGLTLLYRQLDTKRAKNILASSRSLQSKEELEDRVWTGLRSGNCNQQIKIDKS